MYDRTTRRIRTALTGATLIAFTLGASACASGNTSGHDGQESSSSASASSSSTTPKLSPSESAATTQPAPTPTVTEAEPTPQPSGTVDQAPAEPTQTPSAQPTQPTPSNPPGQEPSSSSEAASSESSCGRGDLHVAVDTSNGAAGSTYYTMTFTNSGSNPCKISGYPTVNFIGGSGQTIGAAATPATDLGGTGATLQPGDSTSAILRSTQPDLYGSTCEKTNASGLRIAAPGSKDSLDVPFTFSACGNPAVSQLSVSKVGVQG
ncbi:DUF4232 domain-containing protein [uncultured Kocuria sp.]|uniref:DUF4232 domain-containing protein n=1 Tax=uncultured Kocuria sp. TaxID=259305 RepID=UPI0025931FE7|nr:DUF4232 domain-containing protein [uncultured Kocuria sp.]MCT1368431.1 DUF4232 domain-containing protein [Rothia sp. p3-SID1597]